MFTNFVSYIHPVLLEEISSAFNEPVKIELFKGVKQVNSGKANFSFGSLHTVFKKSFQQLKPKVSDCDSILILGFAAGSVYKLLREDLKYEQTILGLDHDKKMFEIAENHFNISEKNDPKLHLILDDAFVYFKEKTSDIDFVIIDLFYDVNVPELFLSNQFLAQIKYYVAKGGTVLWNVMGSFDQMKDLRKRLDGLELYITEAKVSINFRKNYVFLIESL